MLCKKTSNLLYAKKVNMKKIRKKPVLSVQYIIRLSKIFEKNNWYIEDDCEAEGSLFNRYCERLLAIGNNQARELMLELTERYLWIQEEDYTDHLIGALKKLMQNSDMIDEFTKIYVMPLIAPEDEGRTKSSGMLVYLFNSVKLRHDPILSNYKFIIVDDKSKILKYLDEDNSILILADDFIGTGETAEKCLNQLYKDGVDERKILIVSLVVQQMGLEHLSKYNVYIESSVVRNRGISDYYSNDVLEKTCDIMRWIENRMSIKNKYQFGYGASESLVTMCRTPNNTFPLFWEEKDNFNTAPFPRF